MSVYANTDSVYLILSNREKCSRILCKKERSINDIMDFCISLHLVLEIGLNAFFRNILGIMSKQIVERPKLYENLDNIGFIDKVTLFIYLGDFKFPDIEKAKKYHKIIGKLRNFNGMRNKLLHGHSASTHYSDAGVSKSKLGANLTEARLLKQIDDFKFIIEGVGFYFDHLVCGIKDHARADFKKQYLDTSFL